MVPNGGMGKKVKSKLRNYGLKAIWEVLRCSLIRIIKKTITLELPDDQWGFKIDFP